MNKQFKVSIVVPGKFHSFYLAKGLQKKNVLFSIITSYPKYLVLKYQIKDESIKSIFIKEIIERVLLKLNLNFILSKIYFYLNSLFENLSTKMIEFNKIDILVAWSGSAEKSFKKINLLKKNIIKILERGSTHISFQNKILEEEFKNLKIDKIPIDKRIIEKEIREYNLSDYIFVPSAFAKKTFIENGINEKKIIKVPYGTNLDEFYAEENISKQFTIISTGHISVRKGSLYLLEAFNELNLDDSKLLMVGNIEKELFPFLKPFFLNPNIIFQKHINQKKLRSFYNNSNLFVTSSLEEGLAVVQIQAMACGLPLICTPNSGGEELIEEGKNGFVCPIRDKDYLKNKIIYFYNNREELKIFGKNSNYKAKNYFSWDKYSQDIYEEYKKLII